MVNGTSTFYRIIILLAQLGEVSIINKQISYVYNIALGSNGAYSLINSSYINLNPPAFTILSLDEVRKDSNIKTIALYLL